MRSTLYVRRLVIGLMMVLFTPAVLRAQSGDITIPAGTDYLYTQPGTVGVFPAPIGTIPLVGDPIYQNGSDTVVSRLSDADATTGAAINTQLTGLALMGTGANSNLSVTLDPANLANDVGTMSFLTVGPTVPGTEIGGTITDTLTVYYLVSIGGTPVGTGVEHFTSSGTWEAFLPAGQNEVTDFKIIIDTHVDPSGSIHVVSSFMVPEPSTWIMLAAAGLIVPTYVVRRGRRRA